MELIDTHVHINFPDYSADLEQVRDRWRAAGVTRLVHACVNPADFPQMQKLADTIPELGLAVGLHPLSAGEVWHPDLGTQIRELAQSEPRVVAIGETGLDFYKAENEKAQTEAFCAQLQIAQDLGLPVIIHCRDAAEATYQVLQDFPKVQGVMHCWAGTPQETEWFLSLGMYISFSGIVTFKNAKQIQASSQIVPSDRLLIETDCPFLAPTPQRGKRNEPALVKYVAEKLASLRHIPTAELARQTTANAKALFRL
ncbi:MAG: TatD family hydrolase [Pseudanabaenaceae cyanobacterium]